MAYVTEFVPRREPSPRHFATANCRTLIAPRSSRVIADAAAVAATERPPSQHEPVPRGTAAPAPPHHTRSSAPLGQPARAFRQILAFEQIQGDGDGIEANQINRPHVCRSFTCRDRASGMGSRSPEQQTWNLRPRREGQSAESDTRQDEAVANPDNGQPPKPQQPQPITEADTGPTSARNGIHRTRR